MSPVFSCSLAVLSPRIMPPELPTLTVRPIGIVHSPWLDKRSAPRQPAEARGVEGRIELLADGPYEHALEDLDAWSHVWVLFWFHLNTSWRPKVLPPRSHKKRGVFATRSPYRPNPIGMSVLALTRIEGRVLHVRDVDILDQTPVLDIKPYVAYTDAPAATNAGWLEEQAPSDPGPRYQVLFGPRAELQLTWLHQRIGFDLRGMAGAVLRAGPAPHAYRRITALAEYSVLAVKDFRLRFTVEGSVVEVHDVLSGYRKRVLDDPAATPTETTPLSVHRALMATFHS
jgi:tRNA-Thr(GGU) m(6)t(6)A37 methyltransferase TsaA